MKLQIPALNTILVLEKPWIATVSYESRNLEFLCTFFEKDSIAELRDTAWPNHKIDHHSYRPYEGLKVDIEIPAGTELRVDRIYIKKALEEYDSITFRVLKTAKHHFYGRFWVPLSCANQLHYSEEQICDLVN